MTPILRNIQSAIHASPDLLSELKNALKDGQDQVLAFLQERVFSKQSSIRDTISRNKRINFTNDFNSKAPGDTMKQKANLMESNGLVAIFNLAEKNKLIDLATILQNRVTEECLSVYNVDGSMRKTKKSKLLEKFLLTPVLEVPREYASLIDMGYIWRLATPTPEDKESIHRDGLDYTWGGIYF